MDSRGTSLEAPPASERRTATDAEQAAGISVRSLAHRYGELEVLSGLSLAVAAGEVVALVGPSGCGKSTLLELVGGLAVPAAGEVVVGDERSPRGRLERCGWMPQGDGLLPWRRADDNAALALRLRGVGRATARERAGAMLGRLGLEGFERSYPSQLSVGMRQRVALARTLLTEKPALLLDEPFAALDAITRGELQTLLAGVLRDEGRTTVLVTHDVEEALYVADRVLVLSPRPARVVWQVASPVARRLPRAAAISAPEFVAAREGALEVLGEMRR